MHSAFAAFYIILFILLATSIILVFFESNINKLDKTAKLSGTANFTVLIYTSLTIIMHVIFKNASQFYMLVY